MKRFHKKLRKFNEEKTMTLRDYVEKYEKGIDLENLECYVTDFAIDYYDRQYDLNSEVTAEEAKDIIDGYLNEYYASYSSREDFFIEMLENAGLSDKTMIDTIIDYFDLDRFIHDLEYNDEFTIYDTRIGICVFRRA